jgi:hypothetical protein
MSNVRFDDFGDDLEGASIPSPAGIDKSALSTVNGGDGGLVSCPKCNGSGQTRWGACFSCKGKGKRTVRSVAASKATQTRAENLRMNYAAWTKSPVGDYCLRNQDWNEFAAKMIGSAQEWGKLTENQTAAVERMMAKSAARAEQKKAEKVEKAAERKVDMTAIEALFATVTANGHKSPKFYARNVRLSLAKPGSRNPGAIYVKENGQYAGKIVGGIFNPVYGASETVLATVQEIAKDPRGYAIATGIETVTCCCCGIELTDPVSKANGIGPICATKWGF